MSEKIPFIASTKEEAIEYRKKNSTASDLKGKITDQELLWDGDESKLDARRSMANKIYGIQDSGRLVVSDGSYYASGMHDDLNRDSLFLETLTKIKTHSRKLTEAADKEKADKEAAELAKKINDGKNASGNPGAAVVTVDTEEVNKQKEEAAALLKPEVIGDLGSQFTSFMDSLDTADQWRMGLLLTDVASTAVGYIPGAHIGSAAVGAASTLGYAGIDFTDEDVHWWDATKSLALGLSLDVLSLVGGKGLKAAKSIGKLAPLLAKAVPSMRVGLMAYAAHGGLSAQQKTDWKAIFDDKDISTWTMEDYANAAAAAQFLMGGAKAIGRGTVNRIAKGNDTNHSRSTGLERNFVGKGMAKVVKKAKDSRGVYTKYERPAAYAGQQVAANIVGKPSIIQAVTGHKNMRTSRTNANKAGDILQKKTHNTDVARNATNRARGRTNQAVYNARNSRARVGVPERNSVPFSGARNSSVGNINLQPVKLRPRSSNSSPVKSAPYRGQPSDYGDLFTQRPPVTKISTGTVKVKQPTIGVDTNQPSPKPAPTSSKVKGGPDDFKNKRTKELKDENKLQKRINKKYQDKKGKEEVARGEKADADKIATADKKQLDKIVGALEPKARGKINKMQKDLDDIVKKKTNSIDKVKKSKLAQEAKLKKATNKKDKAEIQQTIKQHEHIIKSQQKALDNIVVARTSAIKTEAGNKWKNIYRKPRGWASDSALPWLNKRIDKLGKRLPIDGSDIRHMKNVDRAETFAERDTAKLTKKQYTDAEKYLNKASRQIKNNKKKNKKVEKKAMGGKLIRKFQSGATIPGFIQDLIRDIRLSSTPLGYGGSFDKLMEKYSALDAEQKKMLENAYEKEYGVALDVDIKANHSQEDFDTYNRNKQWDMSRNEYDALSPEERSQKHADFIASQGNPDLVHPEGLDPLQELEDKLEKEGKEDYSKMEGYKGWQDLEEKKDVDSEGNPMITQADLDLMQEYEIEEDISMNEEKTEPFDGKGGYKPTGYNWKDAASVLPAVFNPGDILNLINAYKTPKQFTAQYTPTKGTTFSQRAVENAPGYLQMKNRLSQDSFNVKSSDLMTKSTLQKRNLDIKNKSLGELQAQNASYIEGIEQQNREAKDKTNASMVQADNINAQALNKRALMDAQGRAKQDTLLTKRKMNLIGTIGGRLNYGLQMGLNNKNAADVADLKGQYGHYTDFAAQQYASMEGDTRTELEKESLIRDKYNKLYGIDPGSDEFGADYNKQLENYRRTNYLVKRNGYYS